MGASKTKPFSASQKSFARIAKAVGHPARVAILQHLTKEDAVSNKALTKVTHLSETSVHQHLRELANAGLIGGFFYGKQHYYRILPEAYGYIENLKKVVGIDEFE